MAIEAAHYGETRQALQDDPAIQLMAAELVTEIEAGRLTLASLQHDTGTPRHDFMGAALAEYKSRTRRPIPTHIGGPAEAILTILGGGQ